MALTEAMREFFRQKGREGARIRKKKYSHADFVKWGKKSGKGLTADERTERARKAGVAGAKARKASHGKDTVRTHRKQKRLPRAR